MRALLVLCLLLPGASALAVNATDTPPELYPGRPGVMTFEAHLTCDAPSWGRWPAEARSLELDITAQPTVQIRMPESINVDMNPCLQGASHVTETIAAELLTSMSTPGDSYVQVLLEARDSGSGDSVVFESRIPTAFIGTFEMTTEESVQKEGPQKQITYMAQVVNTGNSQLVVEFSAEQPEHGDLVLPDNVVLGMVGSGHESQTVAIIYATPFENGANHVTEDLAVTAHAFSTRDDPRAGESHTVDLTAQTEGMYVPAPGLGLLLVGLVALARRR